jgi:DNA (cytosine-5)-methyltransferase 1
LTETLLIRDVPREIHDWIRDERDRSLKTQNELVLEILDRAFQGSTQMPLFVPKQRVDVVPGSLPFTFIDLFAGIGGLRQGLERVGGRCVFSCEWDRYAQKTYKAWYGELPYGDIRKLDPATIPDHDILAAGFPCQPFSIAGVSKKKSLGREHGFLDKTQGTLFFHLATLIGLKRPPVLMLENVKNLRSHDGGRTWEVIKTTLENLRYKIFDRVLDAAGWVPQHRERVFIVGFDKEVFGEDISFDFDRVKPLAGEKPKLSDILEEKPDPKYTLSAHLWNYLQEYAARHKEKGNGFGFGIASPDGTTRTLSARYYKDGSEILIRQRGKSPRRLTPRECARLMGFPDDLPIVVSDTQAYRQFGNAVVPLVAQAVGREVVRVLADHLLRDGALLKKRRPHLVANSEA